MMKKLFLFLIFCSFASFGQNQNSFPVFPGCGEEEIADLPKCFQEKLKLHIRENHTNLTQASREKLKGKATVEYAIEPDGNITITKVEGENLILNEEAKRIITLLPKMQPAYQNGKATRMLLSIPISF